MRKIVISVAVDMELYKKAQRLGFQGVYSSILEEALKLLIEKVDEDFIYLSRGKKKGFIMEVLSLREGQEKALAEEGGGRKGQVNGNEIKINSLLLEEYQNLW